jgi:hypothetical protein
MRDVGCPNSEVGRLERRGVDGAKVQHRLACGPQDVGQVREQRRRTCTSGYEHDIGGMMFAVGGNDTAGARAIFQQARKLFTLAQRDAFYRLTACVVRPLVSADWWRQTLALLDGLAREVPCYELQFDTSGEASGLIASLVQTPTPT